MQVALDDPPPVLRLPTDVRPLAESIELRIDPKQDRFSGTVDIDVELGRARAVVWMHGREMHVSRASITPSGGAPVLATWSQQNDSGLAALKPAGAIPAGKARVRIDFDAPFATGQKGLYRTSEAGVPYAFTQFEATAARMAFPCFDEPSFKIPFTTTLIVPADVQAVANTSEVSRAPDGPSIRIAFAPTLPLPSYLVAFAVGPLDITPVVTAPPNEVRTTPLSVRGVTPRGRRKGDRLRDRPHGRDSRCAREVPRRRVPVRQARYPRGTWARAVRWRTRARSCSASASS